MKKVISILSLCLIFSFTSLYAEIDGYKDLKFGMNNSKVFDILLDECDDAEIDKDGDVIGKKCYKLLGVKRNLTALFIDKRLAEIQVSMTTGELLKGTLTVNQPSWNTLSKGLRKKYELYNEGIVSQPSVKASFFEKGQILTLGGNQYNSMFDMNVPKGVLIYLDKKTAEKYLVSLGLKKSDDSEF
jgi:hypothetical protein